MTAEELRALLARVPVTIPPARARRAAVLILLSHPADGDGGGPRLVYTRRRDDLRNHPGQISFPGGGLEPGETFEEAALREAVEEISLDPSSVTIAGRLEPFYLTPSRFWLVPVVAFWNRPHRLVPQPSEVAEILSVPLSTLTDPDALRYVQVSSVGESWAWQLDDEHLLWGATGRVTAALLDVVRPGWAPVPAPGDLAPDRMVAPWLRRVTPPRHPSRIAQRIRDALRPDGGEPLVSRPDPRAWARQTAALAEHLVEPAGSIGVLVGAGGKGRLAALVAEELRRRGHDVVRHGVHDDGAVVPVDLVVDGLVGRGLSGPLRGAPLEVVHDLQTFTPRVLAIDLPTGLDPRAGMVGEVLAADLTVTYGEPAPGVFALGVTPFCGEIVGMRRGSGGGASGGAPLEPVLLAPDGAGEEAVIGWRE